MTESDLKNALYFLQRVCARGEEEQLLVNTVTALAVRAREMEIGRTQVGRILATKL